MSTCPIRVENSESVSERISEIRPRYAWLPFAGTGSLLRLLVLRAQSGEFFVGCVRTCRLHNPEPADSCISCKAIGHGCRQPTAEASKELGTLRKFWLSGP